MHKYRRSSDEGRLFHEKATETWIQDTFSDRDMEQDTLYVGTGYIVCWNRICTYICVFTDEGSCIVGETFESLVRTK